MKLDILEIALGNDILDIKQIKDILKSNSLDFFQSLKEYKLVFDEEDTEVVDELENIYFKLSIYIINRYSEFYFNMPIEMAIATKEEESIKKVFFDIAYKLGFGDKLQLQINDDLDKISNRLNKRFSFDSASLIHLIEASKGSNIQLEELKNRYSINGKRQILKQDIDGTYKLVETDNIDKYTKGGTITNIEQKEKILLSSYPGVSDISISDSTSDIMKKIMKNLFANLNLCFEIYKVFYTKESNDRCAVANRAVLADDSEFEFNYIINNRNLPHLLGIPKGILLSDDTIKYFDNRITKSSSALEILQMLIINQERIINDGGLMEKDGKMYQIFPWEKIILKTSSFMRGDFFKTCFCLAQLHNTHILSDKEKYVSIAPTKYDEDFTSKKFNAKVVLRDLMLIAKQSKDFIFRTFIEEYDRSGSLIYIPQSIITGKSEDIIVGKNKERIRTLDRFRYALKDVDGAHIVKSIENENIGKRIYTPIEQALTHISIGNSLGVDMELSYEAIQFEQEIKDILEQELDISIENIIRPLCKRNKK